MGFGTELGYKAKSLWNHEAAGPRLLDGVADGIEPDHAYSRMLKLVENCFQITLAFRMLHVDVDLLGSKRGPKKASFAAFQHDICEWQARARTINAQKIFLACTRWKNTVIRQKH